MKKSIFLFLFINIIGFGNASAQSLNDVLISIDGKPVTYEEFKYIYEKNNGKEADYSEKSIREYLKLYTNFKLKVASAKDQKIDTIETLREELDGYKKQLTNSYIAEKEIGASLMQEISERQKYDVKFKHLFVNMPSDLNDSMAMRAKLRIETIAKEIEKGKTFDAAVKEHSDDTSTKDTGGDLGYWSAPMPDGFYDLEQALYALEVGKVSKPIKTRVGYHLVMLTDKRPAKGYIKVAHILVKKTQDGSGQMKINQLFERLKNGEDFDQLAASNSDDAESAKNGGQLPAFGINTYDPIFEEAAFAIKGDGELAKTIIETQSGYHIIKRIGLPAGTEAQNLKKQLENRTRKGERYDVALQQLLRDVRISGKYKENKGVIEKFTSTLNEDFFLYKWNQDMNSPLNNEMVASLGDQKFNILDFSNFVRKNTRTRLKYDRDKSNLTKAVDELFREYADDKAIQYEQKLLEMKYPEFKALMREYEEGILLFEVTKRSIWDKANQDTVGLTKFFESRKDTYKTEAKAKLLNYFISTNDLKFAEKIQKFAKKKSPEQVMKKFNKDSVIIVNFASEVLDKDNSKLTKVEWKKSAQSILEKNQDTGGYIFTMIDNITPSRNKSLKEARGYVVAEYQDFLEKEWIAELSKKYNVVFNEDAILKLIKK